MAAASAAGLLRLCRCWADYYTLYIDIRVWLYIHQRGVVGYRGLCRVFLPRMGVVTCTLAFTNVAVEKCADIIVTPNTHYSQLLDLVCLLRKFEGSIEIDRRTPPRSARRPAARARRAIGTLRRTGRRTQPSTNRAHRGDAIILVIACIIA